MRSELVTTFWRNAYESLPEGVRERHYGAFVAAERWELTLGTLIEAWTRTKNAARGSFQQPDFAK